MKGVENRRDTNYHPHSVYSISRTDMTDSVSYDFNSDDASKADNVANRIDRSDGYIGRFKSVNAMKSSKGTSGVHFEFESPGGGSANFDLWTRKEDGTAVFGVNQLSAIQAVLGLRGLRSVTGSYEGFVEGKRQEIMGQVFPELVGKDIGLVLQKELYTKGDGKEGFRMNLYGVFHPTSRLTASEMKEGKTTPEKVEKMLRGLKTKDSRINVGLPVEPAQPPVGADAGSY